MKLSILAAASFAGAFASRPLRPTANVRISIDLSTQTDAVESSSGALCLAGLDGARRLFHAARLLRADRPAAHALFAQISHVADAAFDLLPRRLRHSRHLRHRRARPAGVAWLRAPRAGQRGERLYRDGPERRRQHFDHRRGAAGGTRYASAPSQPRALRQSPS